MNGTLKLYELPPSPNNMKARIALGYKKLTYEHHEIMIDEYPGDRSQLIEVSGQPLTPVLYHGGRVIFDSGAILRYLDANFRETPPLFSSDIAKMRAIEELEWFARTELVLPVGMIFRTATGRENDPDVATKASVLMNELTGRFEKRLDEGQFLLGDRLTAADVTAAPVVYYAMLPEEAANNPIIRFCFENLKLGDGRDRTRDWVRRVMIYDELMG